MRPWRHARRRGYRARRARRVSQRERKGRILQGLSQTLIRPFGESALLVEIGDRIDDAVVAYEKSYNDKRDLIGPFDVIGDVHGCRSELETLLGELGYVISRGASSSSSSA